MSDSPQKRIVITDEHRAALRAQQARTGRGARAVFGNDPDRPDGLGFKMIRDWVSGHARTARSDYLAYVLAKWASLPDGVERIVLTEEILMGFREHRQRTGIGIERLLARQSDVPEGLNVGTTAGTATGPVAHARPR